MNESPAHARTFPRLGMAEEALRRFVSPPVFPDDDRKTHRAYVMNAALLGFIAASCAAIVANLATGGHLPAVVVSLLAVYLALCPLFLRWNRQGHVERAAAVGLTLGWFMITWQIGMIGTIRVPVAGFYLFIVQIAGLVLGLPAMALATLRCSVSVGGLMLAMESGMLPEPDYTTNAMQWMSATGLFACVGCITFAAIHFVQGSLDRADREVVERRDAEAELTRKNRELQDALD